MTTLTFQNTAMTVISQKNKTFFTSFDLGKALGYKNPSADIPNLYNRNADEFTAEMTALIELQTAGGKQQVRVFSLRGAHLIAMFARTKVAKDFRKWVLDILDREISENEQQIAPLEPKPDVVLPHEKAEQIAKYLVRARAFAKEVEVFHRKLYEDLGIPRYIKNEIAAKGYDIAHEFNVWLDPFIEQALPQLNQQRLANF
ncbi:Bro-N domain-containing protein [Glaesserella parasuis]|uniref:BRO-N domain-containing protein n=1 Tax=Glaesserella parasuis TaxID=738 RepID=UPI0024372AC8|nr:Bro-N domain-containing protein [Glaesserella parasuis]MDG6828755.1 Bro-N domain-containing protein [Glaesserella parasuis]MDO9926942.1 Bro-N domain-containing protein [Glaesserella parasuis]MDO9931419.1 Bro-N domain-containing protein [Glaesserella parasuis]MDO9962263.1 Bro-N domain-containing protein [Glaesserella parasuis]MDO9982495.1 Bro-N domain-containing protein [Glaesserella parasuis]